MWPWRSDNAIGVAGGLLERTMFKKDCCPKSCSKESGLISEMDTSSNWTRLKTSQKGWSCD